MDFGLGMSVGNSMNSMNSMNMLDNGPLDLGIDGLTSSSKSPPRIHTHIHTYIHIYITSDFIL